MALQFILGESGSGKSDYAMKRLIEEAMAHPKNRYMILVPAQFTMQTQKDIVRMHPCRGVLNIDILSFERLAYRVFEEVGTDILEILDDTGKNLILRRVLEQVKPELSVFAKKVNYRGFLEEVKSVLSEFGQYRIGEAELIRMEESATEKPLLSAKLRDIHVIYNGFREMIAEKYITSEALLEVLSRQISKSKLVNGCYVLIDGFTGFTPVQYQFLEQLLVCCRELVLTAVFSEQAYAKAPEEGELYGLSRSMITKMTDLAVRNQIPIMPCVWMPKPAYRFLESPALEHLERYLFSDEAPAVFTGEQAVYLDGLDSSAEEVEFAAARIHQLVRKQGFRYRDIAIITADMEHYYRLIRDVFSEQDIPVFIDYKRDIMGNPCVELIQSAFMIVEQNYSYESVFRYLRTGMSKIERNGIDLLENFVLAKNVRGHAQYSAAADPDTQTVWDSDTKTIRGEKRETVNAVRNCVGQQLHDFYAAMKKKNATVRDRMTALYQLLEQIEAEKQLEDYAEKFQAEGKMDQSREYLQIWKTVMELFEKVVRLFGDMQISISELREILESGFHEIKVAVIPPGLDEVTAGDTIRTRLTDVKVLFFLGVNDGIVPPASVPGGILSNMDRTFLRQQSFELAPTVREQSAIDRFYLYLALTKASHALYLTYSRTDGDGKVLRPAALTEQVRQVFGQTLPSGEESGSSGQLQKFTGSRALLKYAAGRIGQYRETEPDKMWQEVFSFLKRQPEFRDQVEMIVSGSVYEAENDRLSQAVAHMLYPDAEIRSITRLENYAACAYCHFMQYGLALVPREIYQVESTDIGTLFHNVLEGISGKMEDGTYSWRTLTDEQRHTLVETEVKRVVENFPGDVISSSARNSYMINRLNRMADRTVWVLCRQIRQGAFEPAYYEFDSGNGRIDRIDLYEGEDAVYLKIIDYKSGMKQFSLADAYFGLQMQLVWYLQDAAKKLKTEFQKEIRPGAIFYYHIQDPYVKKAEPDYLKVFLMSGLVNSRVEVIENLDRELSEQKESSVIPVRYTKNGAIDYRSKTATEAQFAALQNYITEKAETIQQKIRSGHIEKNPYQKGKKTPCDYCAYKNACNFDPRFPGFSYRTLKHMKTDVIWEQMEKGGQANELDREPEKGD